MDFYCVFEKYRLSLGCLKDIALGFGEAEKGASLHILISIWTYLEVLLICFLIFNQLYSLF